MAEKGLYYPLPKFSKGDQFLASVVGSKRSVVSGTVKSLDVTKLGFYFSLGSSKRLEFGDFCIGVQLYTA